MWETLNTDQQSSSRKKRRDLAELVAKVWFSEHSAEARSPDEQRERAWAQLGEDLGLSTTALGPEAIALLAYEHGVNVLLFVGHSEVHDFGARTTQAVDRWRTATEEERQDQLRLTNRKTAV
jgi:hypothetical protein